MTITDALLTPNSYSRRQKPNVPKKIVVHYVGNPGSSAMGNRNYFESLKTGVKQSDGLYRKASAHYVVGLKAEIVRCIPENEEAIHASSNEMNVSSIGIEICHPDWTGKFTNITLGAVIELCVDICKRYGLNPLTDIIRHHDINGKDCPRWFVAHPEDFIAFKEAINKQLHPIDPKQQRIAETVAGLTSTKRKDGVTAVSLDGAYWTKVFNGEVVASPENVMVIMRRLMKME